jgi:uncharacterized protein (TIGR02391 family)
MQHLYNKIAEIRNKKAEDYNTLALLDNDIQKCILYMKTLISSDLNKLSEIDFYELFYKNVGYEYQSNELFFNTFLDQFLENSRWRRKAQLDNAIDVFNDFSNVEDNPKDELQSDFFKDINFYIRNVSEALFRDGHYKEAVYNACIEIEEKVKAIHKEVKGIEKSGKALMQEAFSEDESKRSIKLNNLSNTSEKDAQEGYRFIFTGFISAIRNPKSHSNFEISKTEAIHLIYMASHLAKVLQKRVIGDNELPDIDPDTINVTMPF